MRHEFYDCLRTGCYVSSDIIKREPLAVWPQKVKAQPFRDFFIWDFYIEWKPELRGQANGRLVCELHHQALLNLLKTEIELEIREQEATEQWLIRVNNQMSRS